MKVVIFEDEMHNAERLVQLLKKADAGIVVTAVIPSVAEGHKWIDQNNGAVDLIMMDIQLSDGNCFEIFSRSQIKTPVIFTTAYDQFALQAFKVNSLDYLMKPIDLTELKNALKKFEQFRPAIPHIDIAKLAEEFQKRENQRFISRMNNQLIYVKAKEIAYLQYQRSVTYATTYKNEKLPLDYSLDQIEKMLNKNNFFRINRQFIVNIDAIKKINVYYNSRLILQLIPHVDTDVVISREKVNEFKNWLEGIT
jgi:DNA-binding LytR/AlgR family response regulator